MQSRRLMLAGIAIQFDFSPEFTSLAPVDALSPFFTSEPPAVHARVELFPEDHEPFFPAAGARYPMFESEEGLPYRRFRLILLNPTGPKPHGFGRLSLGVGSAVFTVSRTFDPDVTLANIFNPFFLPLLLGLLLFDHGVLPIHANAVTRDEQAILLTGRSRCGKTTLTRLLHDHAGCGHLSDDQVWLRHESGKWWVYASPRNWAYKRYFLPRAEDPRRGFPLSAVVALGHGEQNVVKPLESHRFFRILLDQTYPRANDARMSDLYYDRLAALCESKVCHEYKFLPQPEAAETLRHYLASL